VAVKRKRARLDAMTSYPSRIALANCWRKSKNTCLDALFLVIDALISAVRNGELARQTILAGVAGYALARADH
jgi:hypothetical protein